MNFCLTIFSLMFVLFLHKRYKKYNEKAEVCFCISYFVVKYSILKEIRISYEKRPLLDKHFVISYFLHFWISMYLQFSLKLHKLLKFQCLPRNGQNVVRFEFFCFSIPYRCEHKSNRWACPPLAMMYHAVQSLKIEMDFFKQYFLKIVSC